MHTSRLGERLQQNRLRDDIQHLVDIDEIFCKQVPSGSVQKATGRNPFSEYLQFDSHLIDGFLILGNGLLDSP